MTKLEKLIKLLENLVKIAYTGSVIVHFSQGGIGDIEQNERKKL